MIGFVESESFCFKNGKLTPEVSKQWFVSISTRERAIKSINLKIVPEYCSLNFDLVCMGIFILLWVMKFG